MFLGFVDLLHKSVGMRCLIKGVLSWGTGVARGQQLSHLFREGECCSGNLLSNCSNLKYLINWKISCLLSNLMMNNKEPRFQTCRQWCVASVLILTGRLFLQQHSGLPENKNVIFLKVDVDEAEVSVFLLWSLQVWSNSLFTTTAASGEISNLKLRTYSDFN